MAHKVELHAISIIIACAISTFGTTFCRADPMMTSSLQGEFVFLDGALQGRSVFDLVKRFRQVRRLTLRNSPRSAANLGRLSELKSLVALELTNVRLDENALRTIAGLDALQTLNLDNCTITDGRWLDHLHRMQSLAEFQIRFQETDSVHLASLAFLDGMPLRHISIRTVGARTSDKLLWISDLKHVTQLTLSGLTAHSIRFRSPLPNLVTLRLGGGVPVEDLGSLLESPIKSVHCGALQIPSIKRLTELDEVYIHFSGDCDSQIIQLNEIPDLKRLEFHHCDFDWRVLENLKLLPELHTLRLVSTSSTKHLGLTEIGQLRTLSELEVDGSPSIRFTIDDAKAIGSLPHLKRLCLHDLDLGDEHVRSLGGARKLRCLHLGRMNVTDAGLETIVSRFENLEELRLRNSGVTFAGLQSLHRMSKLKTLRILGVGGVAMTAGELRSLQELLNNTTISD